MSLMSLMRAARSASASSQKLMLLARRGMATGTVKWFNRTKGYGFIVNDDDGRDLFAHHTNIKCSGFRFLNQGERVQFDIQGADDRIAAVNILSEDGTELKRSEFQAAAASGFSRDMDYGSSADSFESASSQVSFEASESAEPDEYLYNHEPLDNMPLNDEEPLDTLGRSRGSDL